MSQSKVKNLKIQMIAKYDFSDNTPPICEENCWVIFATSSFAYYFLADSIFGLQFWGLNFCIFLICF